ncbi:MAG: PHP domain-containing protein [Acholeplasmatales bacterium]|nr:PHP domain-containing protein [Acholeplasmatales bacterium]
MKIDLHNHTKHSDGVLTSSELIDRARLNKVDIFALTDHDSVFGCDEIEELAKNTNVRIIKGMELSTTYDGESVHIICLFKNNVIPNEILEFSNGLLERRKERAIKMMNLIHDIYGLKIDIDLLIKDSQIITRANMMRNIAICNNISLKEASFIFQMILKLISLQLK